MKKPEPLASLAPEQIIHDATQHGTGDDARSHPLTRIRGAVEQAHIVTLEFRAVGQPAHHRLDDEWWRVGVHRLLDVADGMQQHRTDRFTGFIRILLARFLPACAAAPLLDRLTK